MPQEPPEEATNAVYARIESARLTINRLKSPSVEIDKFSKTIFGQPLEDRTVSWTALSELLQSVNDLTFRALALPSLTRLVPILPAPGQPSAMHAAVKLGQSVDDDQSKLTAIEHLAPVLSGLQKPEDQRDCFDALATGLTQSMQGDRFRTSAVRTLAKVIPELVEEIRGNCFDALDQPIRWIHHEGLRLDAILCKVPVIQHLPLKDRVRSRRALTELAKTMSGERTKEVITEINLSRRAEEGRNQLSPRDVARDMRDRARAAGQEVGHLLQRAYRRFRRR